MRLLFDDSCYSCPPIGLFIAAISALRKEGQKRYYNEAIFNLIEFESKPDTSLIFCEFRDEPNFGLKYLEICRQSSDFFDLIYENYDSRKKLC